MIGRGHAVARVPAATQILHQSGLSSRGSVRRGLHAPERTCGGRFREIGDSLVSIRNRLRFFLFQIALALVMACAFVAANNRPNYDSPDAYRCYGFPFAYRFDNVVNSQDALGDGATVQHPRADIIWITSFDEVGIIANIGVGVWLTVVTLIVSYVVRQKMLGAS